MNFLPQKIAFRYIFSKKSHSALNLISAVAVCGIIVATAAMMCVLSVFNGFSMLIESKLSTVDPDIKVYPRLGKEISNADSVAEALQREFDRIAIAIPVIEENALAMYVDNQMPVNVKAVGNRYDETCGISAAVKSDGRYCLSDTMGDYALLSVGASYELEANPGYHAYLRLFAPRRQGKINVNNPVNAFVSDTLFISGVFQVDEISYDAATVIVPISVGRHLFNYPDQATAIEITVADKADVQRLCKDISDKLGPEYVVKDRLMQQDASFRMINVEKWISFLLLGFILLIAMFNVMSALSVLIVEKISSIKFLLNIGANSSLIMRVFAWQTMIVGALGTVIGVLAGVAACLLQQHFGLIKLSGNSETMIVDTYPVCLKLADVLAVCGTSLLISAIASLGVAYIARLIVKAKR